MPDAARAGCPDRCRHTIVFVHAHPDDETLYTGGTMAALAAAGHRVVLVTATDGDAGLTAGHLADGLGARRRTELAAAAEALGVSRVVRLGYRDSGSAPDQVAAGTFATADVETAAARLAEVLVDEAADVVTVYDPAGGYGHPDHRQVHTVGRRAAVLAGTPVVLEATVDRTRLRRALRAVGWLPMLPAGFKASAADRWYADPADITHQLDVRPWVAAKRSALAAHRSQQLADRGSRTVSVLLRLPERISRLVLGTEWFVQRGGPPRPGRSRDLLDTVHGRR